MEEFLATITDDNLMMTAATAVIQLYLGSLHTSELFQILLVDPACEKVFLVVTIIGAVPILVVTAAPILISCHPSVVLVSPLFPVRLEAQPITGVAVGGVGHDGGLLRLELLTEHHCWPAGREAL